MNSLITRPNDVSFFQNIILEKSTNSTISFQDEIKILFKKCTSKDPYHNCNIDLSSAPKVNEKQFQQTVNTVFAELIENKEGYHHLVVRISQKQNRLYKCIMNNGFDVHHSEGKTLLVKRCLGHQESECAYPPYKTMSIGITVVIFNQDLTEFLAVQEKTGPYTGWKAPTGSVDYEKEDELNAAVREVHEETNLDILPEQLSLVAMAPTNNPRGRSPDRNFVYTCKSNTTHELKPQEKEIKQVAWLSVNDFFKDNLPVGHARRPLILQEVVRVAKESLETGRGWKPSPAYWGSGTAAILYQDVSIL